MENIHPVLYAIIGLYRCLFSVPRLAVLGDATENGYGGRCLKFLSRRNDENSGEPAKQCTPQEFQVEESNSQKDGNIQRLQARHIDPGAEEGDIGFVFGLCLNGCTVGYNCPLLPREFPWASS
jgi:hypothetical protein